MKTTKILLLTALILTSCGKPSKKNSSEAPAAPRRADLSPLEGQQNTLDGKALAAAIDELIAAEAAYHQAKVPLTPCDSDAATEKVLANPSLALMETAGVNQIANTGEKTVTPPESNEVTVVTVSQDPGEMFAVAWDSLTKAPVDDQDLELGDSRQLGGNDQFVYGLRAADANLKTDRAHAKDYDLFLFDRQTKVLKTFHTGASAIDSGYDCEDGSETRCASRSSATVDLAKGSLAFAMEIMDDDEEKRTAYDYEYRATFQGDGAKVTGNYEVFFGASQPASLGAST